MRADPRGREIVMEVMLAFVLIVLVLFEAIGFYLSIGLERLGIRLDSTEMPHPGKVDQ